MVRCWHNGEGCRAGHQVGQGGRIEGNGGVALPVGAQQLLVADFVIKIKRVLQAAYQLVVHYRYRPAVPGRVIEEQLVHRIERNGQGRGKTKSRFAQRANGPLLLSKQVVLHHRVGGHAGRIACATVQKQHRVLAGVIVVGGRGRGRKIELEEVVRPVPEIVNQRQARVELGRDVDPHRQRGGNRLRRYTATQKWPFNAGFRSIQIPSELPLLVVDVLRAHQVQHIFAPRGRPQAIVRAHLGEVGGNLAGFGYGEAAGVQLGHKVAVGIVGGEQVVRNGPAAARHQVEAQLAYVAVVSAPRHRLAGHNALAQ